MTQEEMRKIIQETALNAYLEKLVAGTSGNVSIYDRETGIMAITPSNLDYRIMKPEDVVLMHTDGELIYCKEGRKPSSEWRLHAKIYDGMENVNAVIHTHSQHATGFAVTHQEVPVILVEMLPFLGGSIPLAKFGMPGTDEVGVNAVAAMTNPPRNAALLENHGVVAVGKSIEQAYIRAVYVEDAATIYYYALQSGIPQKISREAEVAMREKYHLSKD